jgi:ribonuclease J
MPRTVDGLGIGDVGPIVLSDRLSLSKAGIIVLVLPRTAGSFDFKDIKVISRGFVFMKEADEVIRFVKEQAMEVIQANAGQLKDEELKKKIEKRLSKKLYRVIQREPLIVPVIIDF